MAVNYLFSCEHAVRTYLRNEHESVHHYGDLLAALIMKRPISVVD